MTTKSSGFDVKFQQISDLLKNHTLFHDGLGNINNIENLKVLVLSDPKTGSTALARGFQKWIDGRSKLDNVIHMHTNASCLFRLLPILRKHDIGIKDLVDFRNTLNPEKLLIVTAYREPISRSISHFFETLENHFPGDRNSLLKLNLQAIIRRYFELQSTFIFMRHVHWQLQEYFGLKVVKNCFPKEVGLNYLETNKYRLLVARIDKIEHIANIEVQKSMPYKGFQFSRHNEASSKWYREIYKKFNERIRFPKNVLDIVFWVEQNYLDYFLTDQEIAQIKDRWYSQSIETEQDGLKSTDFFDDFDYKNYLLLNPDLAANGINDQYSARWHYAVYGMENGRRYK